MHIHAATLTQLRSLRPQGRHGGALRGNKAQPAPPHPAPPQPAPPPRGRAARLPPHPPVSRLYSAAPPHLHLHHRPLRHAAATNEPEGGGPAAGSPAPRLRPRLPTAAVRTPAAAARGPRRGGREPPLAPRSRQPGHEPALQSGNTAVILGVSEWRAAVRRAPPRPAGEVWALRCKYVPAVSEPVPCGLALCFTSVCWKDLRF